MKSGQNPLFEMLPMELVFELQDGFFHFVWFLALYAFFFKRPPNWKSLPALIALTIVYDGLNTYEELWTLVNHNNWLSDWNAVVFNRLTFFYYIYLATYIAFFIRFISAAKAWRTVFRMFVVFITFVSIGTFSLFHFVVINGGLYAAREDRQVFISSVLEADAPQETVDAICADLSLWCRYTDQPLMLEMEGPDGLAAQGLSNAKTEYLYTQEELYSAMAATLEIVKSDTLPALAQPGAEARLPWAGMYSLDPVNFRLGLFQSVMVYADWTGEEWLIILDKPDFDAQTHKFTLYTAILILMAHLVWVVGGIAMAWIHEKGRTYRMAIRGEQADKMAARADRRRSRIEPLPDGGPAPASSPAE